MTHLGLFEGIGGFSLAVKWLGGKTLAWCEWNEFGQKVLKYHFPEAEGYGDITQTDFKKYEGKIDLLTGGFPCQPFSMAGNRQGTEDERYLWHEMLRAIQEVKPKFIIAENVYGITNIDGGMVFEQVCADMENEGYEVQPFIIPACAKDAPHRRDRIWFIAYRNNTRNTTLQCKTNGNGAQKSLKWEQSFNEFSRPIFERNATNTSSRRMERYWRMGQNRQFQTNEFNENDSKRQPRMDWQEFPTQSPICGRDDGLPTELDGITFPKWRNESIMAYGNAIVPQIAYEIIKQLFSSIL